MNGESIYMELNCSTTEKGVLWISISGKPVMDDQNSVIGISIGLNDITESKQLLFKLTASENNLKSMLQHANESIILTDDNGNIIFWNIISEKIFGYREDEILGKPLSLILPKHSKTDRQRIIQHISKWQSITNDKSIELTGIRKDDTELPLEISPSFWINDNVTYYSVAIRDISDRKKSEKEILLMNKQLQEHASHMQTVREEERTMIAREIHDELGQQLAYIKMEAERINKKAANDEMLKEMTTEMVDQIGITINAVRKLHSELRPPTLDNLGLFDTIEWKAKDFSFKTGLKCTLHFDNAEPILKQGFAIHVFRIFQESINNCYKYAEASEINIGLKQADGNLIMIIKDNGKGFDLEKVKQNKSFGLQGMKERTKIIDGTIEIISEEEKGTTIVLTVPIN